MPDSSEALAADGIEIPRRQAEWVTAARTAGQKLEKGLAERQASMMTLEPGQDGGQWLTRGRQAGDGGRRGQFRP
jgi:hypothetical protein